ncbi:MAG: hypothetical protein H7Y11_12705, partial [Armatimonadetes bacterium]|nr:hypothetical protein [Anaerolineae bacterium]
MVVNNNIQTPNLVLAQRVVAKMMSAAQHFMEDETGEAMVGLIDPGVNTGGHPTVYVLDTISPDESAVRHFHTFQQGDERQDEIIWWLQENWRAGRAQASDKRYDTPLVYLGDWHKQPGYMIAPSAGDRMTALGWLDDDSNEMDYLLVPIVTLDHPATIASGEGLANYITAPMPDGSYMRVDFWFIHRQLRQ